MAVNKEGNLYTFGFAAIMVVIVGASLAMVSMGLKEQIKKNEADKKMMDILSSISIESTRENAAQIFNTYVTERLVLNASGEVLSSSTEPVNPTNPKDPFNVDVKKEYKKMVSKLVQANKNDKPVLLKKVAAEPVNYPLFKCDVEGTQYYVIPMVGTGLWGPIWGYVSLEDDMRTVYGAAFDHKTETPGLGAEIKEDFFEEQFLGESTYKQDNFVSISVIKGTSGPENKNAVDGITGGTITSNGVSEMLYRTLAIYDNYFKTQR